MSLGQLLDRHPWPEELAALGSRLDVLWSFQLRAPVDRVWPCIIETSRLNRALGVSRMQFEERDGVLVGSAVNAGVRQEWIEEPWDWVAEDSLTSVRRYRRGFAKVVRGVYVVQPADGGGTRVQVYFGWVPSGPVARGILKLGMRWLGGAYARAMEQLDRELVEPVERHDIALLRAPAPPLPDDRAARLASLRDDLRERGVDADALDALVRHVRTGDENELYRIQLRPLARRWQVDERALLLVCLHATRAGLLDMSWDVICPHCRGVRSEAPTLGDVPARDRCDVCDLDFATDAENAVEITFHVHPSIREVPRVFYCSAEPATKRHIHLQQRLGPGETRALATRLRPGCYRARLRGDRPSGWLVVAPGEPDELAWSSAQTGELRCAPAARVVLHNPGDVPETFVVEDAGWAGDALRPRDLFGLQEFRDLFSEQYVGADIQLEVGEQTILFTDIVGSTEFYSARGDPEAFALVKQHFTELYEEVRTHRGAVVKTIGDAAMAAFTDPVDALRCAAAIQRRFARDRADTVIRLRASLNTGPCIAVNLNSGIDYFGGTVNMAAKLQACAEAGQVALPGAVRDAPGVLAYLEDQGARLTELSFSHAALPEPIAVYRWDLHELA